MSVQNTVCKYYLLGKCKFGAECQNRHEQTIPHHIGSTFNSNPNTQFSQPPTSLGHMPISPQGAKSIQKSSVKPPPFFYSLRLNHGSNLLVRDIPQVEELLNRYDFDDSFFITLLYEKAGVPTANSQTLHAYLGNQFSLLADGIAVAEKYVILTVSAIYDETSDAKLPYFNTDHRMHITLATRDKAPKVRSISALDEGRYHRFRHPYVLYGEVTITRY